MTEIEALEEELKQARELQLVPSVIREIERKLRDARWREEYKDVISPPPRRGAPFD